MQEGEDTSSAKFITLSILWLFTITIAGFAGYFLGTGSKASQTVSENVRTDNITPVPTQPQQNTQPTQIPAVASSVTTTPINDTICAKTGPSQKKDYLRAYTLKEGDTVNKIAETELGSVSRNSEITTLNENMKNLTVGSILFLPPESIKESTGYIYEVSGKIVKKDNSAWQLTYGAGPSDLGIWMPAYWFAGISNASQFQIGDCVTILFDNGSKVYSVKSQ